ncbi:acyltransferase [Streptomyces sp. NBC_01187]|uniref:acyltransferase family protein n=1 Tax=Streptomyces sp. NBC_01187 TaxID=2903766 RepID=UPI00386D4C8A|nr:acyltransferase [Streptomyces sp. NBC_01187]
MAVERRTELDALRALVVIGLVFFHSALVFDTETDFYIKNARTTGATRIGAGFGVVWAMPMLFLAAGLGAWYSLRGRGAGGFVRERLLRLGVPLLFAELTILPVPQWLRARSHDPGYDTSYLDFLARFYDVRTEWGKFPFVVQGEHFETGHLWFVLLLLTFSLMLAPLVGLLPRERCRAPVERLAALTARRRCAVLLPALAFAAMSALLGLEESYAGWHHWTYLLFFLCGFLLASDVRFRDAMRRDAWYAAVLGLALFAATLPGFTGADDPLTDMTPLAVSCRTVYGAAGWCWLVAILGLLDRRGRRAPGETEARPGRARRLYAYLGPAVLPLYVLHQPVVVAVAFGVVGWDAPTLVKYGTIVTASLLLTVAAYDLLVRRTRVTRFLFGMRRAPGPEAPSPQRSMTESARSS